MERRRSLSTFWSHNSLGNTVALLLERKTTMKLQVLALAHLASTASAFVLATPVGLLVWLAEPDGIDLWGASMAVLSGAVTSGLGYALWYTVLPRLETSVAALSQLTVPLIAVAGGVLFLAEPATLRVLTAAFIVLGGVAFGILAPQRKIGSSGS